MNDARPGRVLDAGLHLLDRQLIDRHGRLCGKVDDLEVELPDDGTLPVVTAILAGPGVLGQRSGGRFLAGLGRFHTWVARGAGGGPSRIPWSQVAEVTDHVALGVDRADLDAQWGEAWVRAHVIEKLPGADRADR